MITGEDRVRRCKEAERERPIERLNSEEQLPSREEVEKRGRRRGEVAPKESYDWLFLATFSSATVVFGLLVDAETYYVWPGPIWLWIGALSTHTAFRYLGWGRSVVRSIRTVSFVGWCLWRW